ncbi:hypothetical protein GQ53DRAFT_742190, partial [Thozetella sp. PMI_491]
MSGHRLEASGPTRPTPARPTSLASRYRPSAADEALSSHPALSATQWHRSSPTASVECNRAVERMPSRQAPRSGPSRGQQLAETPEISAQGSACDRYRRCPRSVDSETKRGTLARCIKGWILNAELDDPRDFQSALMTMLRSTFRKEVLEDNSAFIIDLALTHLYSLWQEHGPHYKDAANLQSTREGSSSTELAVSQAEDEHLVDSTDSLDTRSLPPASSASTRREHSPETDSHASKEKLEASIGGNCSQAPEGYLAQVTKNATRNLAFIFRNYWPNGLTLSLHDGDTGYVREDIVELCGKKQYPSGKVKFEVIRPKGASIEVVDILLEPLPYSDEDPRVQSDLYLPRRFWDFHSVNSIRGADGGATQKPGTLQASHRVCWESVV